MTHENLFPDEDMPAAKAAKAYPGSIEPDAIDPEFPSSPGAPPEPPQPPSGPPEVDPVETPPGSPVEPIGTPPEEPAPFAPDELSDTGTEPDSEPGFGRQF